jgi:hypothetical protein
MSGSDSNLPQDVTFTKITMTQSASLETAFRKSAAVDGVAVSFNEQSEDGGLVTLAVHFSLLAPVPSPSPPEQAAAGSPQAPPAAPPGVASADVTIAWGRAVMPDFKNALLGMCGRLQVDPNFMMACMAFETGQTFSPSKVNPISGATGLIQFMPTTAADLGTTTALLGRMTAIAQLAFVERYFLPHAGNLKTLSDVYMAILFPRAVGQSESLVLFAIPSKAYAENRGLDSNNDGQVTKAEAAAKVQQALITGLAKVHLG